ncbi:MAG: aminoacetone oxidase family FAD-binding enzyme [Eubacteriaceae bacterium]|nr:aminoacetone oxidase family FAD-binding enzyme [Eubacteriaceae bacterium]
MIDICIIGGGAAGLTAAISAKEANSSLKVAIIEKKNQVGKKILVSGNGKCNMTNLACPGCGDTLDFFRRIGVITRKDSEGRVYPYTEEARAVRDALVGRARSLGVEIITSAEVLGINKQKNFHLDLGNKIIECGKVLISTGGKSSPQCGSTGDGYKFAKAFGHRVSKLIPVLTAIDVEEDMEKLAGIRAKAGVSLTYKGEEVFSERGEVQFTPAGVSGICIFNMSRFLMLPEGKTLKNGFDNYKIHIDFFPDNENLESLLQERIEHGFSGEKLLDYMIRKPIAERIIKLSGGDIRSASALLKDFTLSPSGAKGWNFAQVTKGGVILDEVDSKTMESKLIKNLYFAGEVLDYDGPCGGFNLQYAWETGAKAGRGMARE